jgi:Cu(I)/Ag(I) efflux system membrane fusion protein
MNARGLLVGVAIVCAALAGGVGYWAGGSGKSGGEAAMPSAATPVAASPAAKKLLYYRNPMGLPDTSPTPKKDSMGMDYIAVYEGEDGGDGDSKEVKVSAAKIQKLGVRTEAAMLREVSRSVRAAGRVEVDERRMHTITSKFEGYIEKLHVSATGQPVGRGQPLFEAYSPDLVSAQREYQVAARGLLALKDATPDAQAGMRSLAESALSRLRNWDISDEQVSALAQGGEVRRTLTFRAPASGVVLEKKAVAGMRFMPGEMLYQIADIGAVWVLADVFERDIGSVKAGQKVRVTINAYPDKVFAGTVAYVYPTLNVQTRTVPVRVELANPGGLLKPAMYASVDLSGGAARAKVLAVPNSAVIDSGTRQTILVQKAEGRFEPREVKLGVRSDDFVEVLDGVKEGEMVVVAANFLIDSESNLKAALGGMGGPAESGGKEAAKPGVAHQAEGTLDAVDAKTGMVTVTHGPVASLKWPGMTMEFVPANPALVAGVKPGAHVAFEFVERKQGEWVITKLDAKKH